LACQICQLPTEKRLEIEEALKDAIPYRKLSEMYNLNRNIFMRHKNVCQNQNADSFTKLKQMAEKLEKEGKWRDAAQVYSQIVNIGDSSAEDSFAYLARIAPLLCENCRRIILAGK